MTLHIEGVGNLGAKPEKKKVIVDGEDKPLVSMRVYFDRRRPNGTGGYVEQEGLWRDVAVWKPGLGDRIIQCLNKGARVFVKGTEIGNSYRNSDGEEVSSCTIIADYVAPDLVGVQNITFSNGRGRGHEDASDGDVDLRGEEAAD
ncbi:MAG: single-stranded DNA-binding protein [Geminicoccaceae bacterium]